MLGLVPSTHALISTAETWVLATSARMTVLLAPGLLDCRVASLLAMTA
jgi:hypothetical protein